MKLINWNREKNDWLRKHRSICFEDILYYLANDFLIDDLEHPNQDKYAGQRMMVFNIDEYIYLVPYVETKEEIFLKTIIPSRKATKDYLEHKLKNLDKDEKELLDSFEQNEWLSVKNLDDRKVELQKSAQATIRKDKRVNIRISERDLRELQRIALREGLPYQTLISSILHKYVNGVPID